MNEALPTANGDHETALTRPADDGVPLPAQAEELAPISTNQMPTSPVAISLEERVRRLEDALASLQEQNHAEPHVVSPSVPAPSIDPPSQAAPALSPPVAAQPASTAVLLDIAKRSLAVAPHAVPAASISVAGIVRSPEGAGILWLLWDTWAEVRAIVRMFVDPRYSLPWSARVLPLFVLAAILTSKYWIPGSSIPLLGDWLLVKLVDLLLAFLLFKWLGHEARRYRRNSPDLPSSLRL